MWPKLAVVSVGALVVAGCSSETTTIVPDPDAVSSSQASEDVAALEPAEVQETAPETPAGDEIAELGSRENPLPIETSVTLDDGMGSKWEVTLGAPSLEANDIIAAENMFNEGPPEGFQFALLPVSATYLGEETGMAAWDLDFAFVSAAGTTHKPFDVSVVIPDDLGSLNELYNGGVAEGNIAIAIPSEAANQGTWRIGTSWGDAAAFFSAE